MESESNQLSYPDYINFDLEIGLGSGREYPVVVQSAAGEARETMYFPFDKLTLENKLLALQNALLRSGGKRRLTLSPGEQTVQDFGRALFDALFIGEVHSRYAVSQQAAAYQGKGLRLRLRIQSPELAALPWEFMYDPGRAKYICLSSHTPLVRYLELPLPPQPLPVTPPLRILGMAASPKELADLDIDHEKLRVERATEDLKINGLVELTWLEGQTWQDLQRALRHGPWHIFHFIGHGGFNSRTDEGLIALVDDVGKASYLSARHLGILLADHRSLRLVVLNSCEGAHGSEYDIFSSTASILVQQGIPAVLAMQYEITDRAAIVLSHAFYEAIADGWPVDAAVAEARKAINLEIPNTMEWGTPVLYMRSPNGMLFDVARTSTPPPIQSSSITKEKEATLSLPVPQRQQDEVHSEVTSSPMEERNIQIDNKPGPAVLYEITSSIGAKDSADSQWQLSAVELLNTLRGHTDAVLSIAFSPNGQILASGAQDETVRLWQAIDGKLLRVLKGHKDLVHCVAFSPDGQVLASGSDDKTVRLWRVADGVVLHTLKGHTNRVNSVAFSPDGQVLASGSGDKTVRLWRVADGVVLHTLEEHTRGVSSVVFSPNEQILASGSDDKTIGLWSVADGVILDSLHGHTNWVNSVAFSSNGQILASGSSDKTIRLWRMN